MTANPPTITSNPDHGPSPKVQAQVAELRELARKFPEPSWDEVKSDWEWLYSHSGTVALEPYRNQLVAIYDGKIVGADPEDELALRVRLSREHQRHPERFVISYHG
jgi:hypothetical protein